VSDLQRAPLAARTKHAYGQHVGACGAWLAGQRRGDQAPIDPPARDHAARDFKRHLNLSDKLGSDNAASRYYSPPSVGFPRARDEALR
jgi:hypothetical protein